VSAWLAPKAVAAPVIDPNCVVVAGEFSRASGLGEGARLMHAALVRAGLAVFAVEAGLGPDEAGIGEFAGAVDLRNTPPGAPLVLHVNAPSFAPALLRLPRGAVKGRRIIGYWAWELESLPSAWKHARELLHEIWVPSKFTYDAIAPFYPGRVKIVPHPLAVNARAVCAPKERRVEFALPPEAFVVMCSFSLASGMARKNPLAAIAAFQSAFGDDRENILVMKVAQEAHAPGDWADLLAAIGDAPNIRVISEILSPAQNLNLIEAADVVISLHRSEGFGLVISEAMLAGRVAVATDYGGNTDFLTAQTGVPVGYRMIPAWDPRGVYEGDGARWADADVAQAAAALRELAEDPALRLRLGEAARAAALEHFSSQRLLAALQASEAA